MNSDTPLIISRRSFTSSSLGLASAALVFPKILRATTQESKHLKLYNVHTAEWFKGLVWEKGEYIPEALTEIKKLFRDRRSGEQKDIDPALLNLLHQIQNKVEGKQVLDIVCGYRSKKTNEKLRKIKKGVAKNSYHIQGKAVDLYMRQTRLKELRDIAKSFQAGGVGYYPKSNFVHVDVRGRPAYW